MTTSTLTSGTTTAGTLGASSINNTGSLTVSGESSLQGVTATSLTSSGNLTVDTNVLKVDAGSNRVGVNVTTPSEALDVSGNAKVSGTLTVDTTTLVVNASTNRVGVNVAAPTEALDVTGNIKGSGTLAITGNSTIGGTLGVTGALTANFLTSYTYSTVSANSGTTNFVVATDVNATKINLFLYGLGLSSNSFFIFRIGTDTSTFLTTQIYDYSTQGLEWNAPYAESGNNRTGIRISNDLDNSEFITGMITFRKQPAAHSVPAGWYVNGEVRRSAGGPIIITGFIRHTGSIGAVRFEAAVGNFNRTSYVRSESRREF